MSDTSPTPLRPAPSRDEREALKAVRMMSDRILVRRPEEEGERRSKGGLLIPPTAATVSKRGLWADVVGIEVEIRGDEYLLIREREAHAVASEREEPGGGLYL
jgi:chaperonin GroES